jgi:hypothetical protein
MGRPVLKEEEKRVVQVNIRLTTNENRKVCTYAEASGLTPANWIRQKIFTGRFPVMKISPVEASLYRELHRIGVNLNQAVKQVHAGKSIGVPLSLLNELLTAQQAIIKALLK